ncbi:hypothetical protein WICPIJ_009181 [Wickerhamomyces pijperi]|uniref:Uncharacterized protein n=1 Tax=Wickerhamomyces pijperi TaxID=599730 RepID=A0A9P8TFA0_WICPI|nr:hypothetical protein WICPIJ_009181 [Wickerhamomyces pijperi]
MQLLLEVSTQRPFKLTQNTMSYTTFQPPLTKKRTLFLGSTANKRITGSGDQTQFLINQHGSIPVYGVAQSTRRDASDVVQMIKNGDNNDGSSKQTLTASNTNAVTSQEAVKDEYQVSHYEDSKNFSSVSSNSAFKELAIFSITGLSSFNNNQMRISETEQSLNILLGEKVKYKWFNIEGLDGSDSLVFVKIYDENEENVFSVLKSLYLLKTESIKVDLQSGLRDYIRDYLLLHPDETPQVEETKGDTDQETESDGQETTIVTKKRKIVKEDPKIEKLKHFIKSLKTQQLSQSAQPLDDLDYVIDDNELKGIPEEYIPQLTKDIKEFRLNVIKIEKQKKATEKREAIKRNKEQLKLLYKQFSNGEVKEEEDDDEDDEDDQEGLTDEQYEARKQQQRAEQITKLYNATLITVKNEEKLNLDLKKKLELVKNYEENLKEKYQSSDSVAHDKYKLGEFKYPRGASFIDRTTEAKKDQADRELAAQVASEALDNNTEQQPTASDQDGEAIPTITDTALQISEDKLTQLLEDLKPKINEQVTKLMGFEEPETVDLIVSLVVDLKEKAKIIEELKDILEDSGEELAVFIWNELKQALGTD